jgi:EF hand
MVEFGDRSRGTALALVMIALGAIGWASYPRHARAAEFAQDFPKSYSDFVKMKPMELMHMMDPGKKGFVTKDEFMKWHEAMFDKMDKNKDGKLSREEWLGQIHTKP